MGVQEPHYSRNYFPGLSETRDSWGDGEGEEGAQITKKTESGNSRVVNSEIVWNEKKFFNYFCILNVDIDCCFL